MPQPDLSVRVRPADLARMLNVSKQCVSQWIRSGKVTIDADGRLNPAKACDQVLRNSDPGRIRAKVLRPLADDIGTLRQQLKKRDEEIAILRSEVDRQHSFATNLIAISELYEQLIHAHWDRLRTLQADDAAKAMEHLDDAASLRAGGYDEEAEHAMGEFEAQFDSHLADSAKRDISTWQGEGGGGSVPNQ